MMLETYERAHPLINAPMGDFYMNTGEGYSLQSFDAKANAAQFHPTYVGKETPPEELLAKMIKDDIGVDINPQVLRLWVRWRWDRMTPIAHRIHGS